MVEKITKGLQLSFLWKAVLLFFFVGVLPYATAQPSVGLPANQDLSSLNRVLQTFKPAVTAEKLLPGNDLLLEFKSVAVQGVNRIRVVSALPRTDAIWLLTLSKYPDSGQALLASATFDAGTLPEVVFYPKLFHTQRLLVIARSGQQYYAVSREIKIARAAGDKP